MQPLWNPNIHYHGIVLDSVSSDASRVLDVGCGEGILTIELHDAGISNVVGLDVDGDVLDRARERSAGRPIEWLQGDALTVSLEPASFDAVVSVAALHHMDAAAALTRFAELVGPGGAVVVVGLAANAPSDIPFAVVANTSRFLLGLVHGSWNHSARECWPPPLTYGEMKALGGRILAGGRYQRHWLGRYSLVWRKPVTAVT